MLQLFQSLSDGSTILRETPCPQVRPGHVLICSRASLVSPGTERMLLEFGKAGWLGKARQQPEKVRQALDKIATDGLWATYEAIRGKLDEPIPMGYCNVGEVVEVGAGVEGIRVGDRVASNAPHAEMVLAPRNLLAKIPNGVEDEAAAFTVLGAIALHGVRLLAPALGEAVAVSGLGLIGLLAAQFLKASGCRVIGIDLDSHRLTLAKSLGMETVDISGGGDPGARALELTRGTGVDGVIIAAATASGEPVKQAARMCRKRGKIVMVGATGMEFERGVFYEKELSFQVSCSYGPGRYDPAYEGQGNDYPLAYVRWTEQRNFEAVLEAIRSGAVNTEPLLTHRFAFEKCAEAYALLNAPGDKPLGALLEYRKAPLEKLLERTLPAGPEVVSRAGPGAEPVVALIGAGSFARRSLAPAFAAAGARLHTAASRKGADAADLARKSGFEYSSSDVNAALEDSAVDTVVIATRHGSHAALAARALKLGKNVYVEKPLALTETQLDEIAQAYAEGSKHATPALMVGFNRRFAPHIVTMKRLLEPVRAPKAIVITVNAGALPATHWTFDPDEGGGRIIGEGCHFIDLARHLAGAAITQVTAVSAAGRKDVATITLSFADGSTGTVHYLGNGHQSYPKERVEVFAEGGVLALDNFRVLKGYGWPGFTSMRLWRQDKGHQACVKRFVEAIRKGEPPIPFEELIEVSRATINAASQG